VTNGVAEAVRIGRDVVILDTAGRLAIDEALMAEVKAISAATSPNYTFLVIDAMTGQDAVHTAKAFDETLALDGVILTKLDGDARGGAALSVKYVLGKPIAFASTGERLGDLDVFHPDRMADRILGMGDVLSLIEQAERTMDTAKLGESAGRMLAGQFTFDDFLEQMNQIKKMGSFGSIARLIPGMGKQLKEAAAQFDDREIARIEGMVHSMTAEERRNPDLIDRSRQARIAKGSGRSVTDVAQLLKQFKQMAKMMKSLGGGNVPQMPGMGNPLAMRKQLQAMSAASPEQLSGLLGGAPGTAATPPPWMAKSPVQGSKKGKKKGGRVTPPKGR
jgi:signal recognition particle subunit SRP54